MQVNKNILSKASLMLGLLCASAAAHRTVIPFNEDERIVVKISNSSMNRLSIEGDRIQEVIGINDSIAVEKDSTQGHMFMKTSAGSKDKVDITIITEGGLVQDLTLQPTDREASTLVLKISDTDSDTHHKRKASISPKKASIHNPEPLIPSVLQSNTPYQETLVTLMKVLFIGDFEDNLSSSCSRKSPQGVTTSYSKGFSRDGYAAEAYEISNGGKEPVDLEERDFFQPGDLAIALEQKTLKSCQKTKLYVIRKDS